MLFPIRYVFDVLTPLNGCDDDVCVENEMLRREKKTKMHCDVCAILLSWLFCFPERWARRNRHNGAEKANFRPTQNAQFKWMWKDVNWDTNERKINMIYLNVLLTHSTCTSTFKPSVACVAANMIFVVSDANDDDDKYLELWERRLTIFE